MNLETSTLPFRLENDLVYVCYKKQLLPLCQVLRQLAVDEGLAQVDFEDHDLSSKVHPVACFYKHFSSLTHGNCFFF